MSRASIGKYSNDGTNHDTLSTLSKTHEELADATHRNQGRDSGSARRLLEIAGLAVRASRSSELPGDNHSALELLTKVYSITKLWLDEVEDKLHLHDLYDFDQHSRAGRVERAPKTDFWTLVTKLAVVRWRISRLGDAEHHSLKLQLLQEVHKFIIAHSEDAEGEIRRLQRKLGLEVTHHKLSESRTSKPEDEPYRTAADARGVSPRQHDTSSASYASHHTYQSSRVSDDHVEGSHRSGVPTSKPRSHASSRSLSRNSSIANSSRLDRKTRAATISSINSGSMRGTELLPPVPEGQEQPPRVRPIGSSRHSRDSSSHSKAQAWLLSQGQHPTDQGPRRPMSSSSSIPLGATGSRVGGQSTISRLSDQQSRQQPPSTSNSRSTSGSTSRLPTVVSSDTRSNKSSQATVRPIPTRAPHQNSSSLQQEQEQPLTADAFNLFTDPYQRRPSEPAWDFATLDAPTLAASATSGGERSSRNGRSRPVRGAQDRDPSRYNRQ